MLFRRVKEHVKNEDWFAVFVDFLIVVAGVYIGLQLGNSNTARADKLAYQQALERRPKRPSETSFHRLPQTRFYSLRNLVKMKTVVNAAITKTYGLI